MCDKTASLSRLTVPMSCGVDERDSDSAYYAVTHDDK